MFYFPGKTAPVSTIRPHQDPSTPGSSQSSSVSNLREAINQSAKGLSQDAQNVVASSWRPGTIKQYKTHLDKWNVYCADKHISPYFASVVDGINFLSNCFMKGYSYSALNTARSALSATVTLPTLQQFGSHPLVIRFMKGVYNQRPNLPRYVAT